MALEIDIHTRLGSFTLDAAFRAESELVVLFGHSGSGKSLTLRAVAGLLRPDAGRIVIDGVPVFDAAAGIDVPPQRRGAGLVVQHYGLFPHLTVTDNIAFGLGGLPRRERAARVGELAEMLDIQGLERRYPRQLSGGQQQRVALARALAPRPRLLLLDEPFSALDAAIRAGLRRELARLKRELDLTIVFVTHDLQEAFALGDRVAVYDGGRVLQSGPRDDVFARPSHRRVAELTDVRNIFPGVVECADAGGLLVRAGRFAVRTPPYDYRVGSPVDVCIRPEQAILLRRDRHTGGMLHDTALDVVIVDETHHGTGHTLFLALAGCPPPPRGYDFEVEMPAHPYRVMGVAERRDWTVALTREAVHVMARDA